MAEVKNVDGLISQIMSMGFEMSDAQEALKHGHLSVHEAVGWILDGKPGRINTTPTLKLNQNQGPPPSGPFTPTPGNSSAPAASLPQPPVQQQEETSRYAAESHSVPEEQVVSRSHLSDKQYKLREDFERKQRELARKTACDNKISKKKARQEALQRIAEDRAKHAKKGVVKPSQGDGSNIAKGTEQAAGGSCEKKQNTALLQIRLPEGRPLRNTFQATDTFSEVWSFVEKNYHAPTTNMCLIQPFPRKEYSSTDMKCTLEQLKLTPSGSLVLVARSQSQDKPPAAAVKPQPPQQPADSEAMSVSGDSDSDSEESGDTVGHYMGQGGPGHMLGMGRGGPIGMGRGGGPIGMGRGGGPFNMGGPPYGGHKQNKHSHKAFAGQGNVLGGAESSSSSANKEDGAMAADDEHMDVGQPQAEGLLVVPPPPGAPHHQGGAAGADDSSSSSDSEDDDAMAGVGGGGGGLHPMFMGHQPMGHNWGVGEQLVGPVLNPESLPHHRQNPSRLAASAANKRVERHPLDGGAPPSLQPHPASTSLHMVPSLVDLVIRHISLRIGMDTNQLYRRTSPHPPITNIQAIPATLANRIIQCLITDKKLTAKTLKMFVVCHLNMLKLDYYIITSNDLLKAVGLHKSLRHLSLRSCTLITDAGLQSLQRLKVLKVLNLGDCRQLTNKCCDHIQVLCSLETLIMDNTGIGDEGVQALCSGNSVATLQTLNLNGTRVTHAIWTALAQLPKLTTLYLEHTSISSLTGVQNLASLQALSLAGTSIVTESVMCLIAMKQLRAVNIANTANVHGDQALAILKDMALETLTLPNRMTTTHQGIRCIAHMPLTVLDLTNYIEVDDLAAPYLAQLKSLQKLRLNNTKITNEGILYLTALTNLIELNLDKTQVGDILADVLKAFVQLQELSVSSTNITDALLESRAINHCTMLARLNLSHCAVSNNGVSHLQLPLLSLLNVDYTQCTPDIEQTVAAQCPVLERVICNHQQLPPVPGAAAQDDKMEG